MTERHGLPPHLFTDDPGKWDAQSRIQVDVGQTGFFQGREFRISYEYNIANGATLVFKFSSPVDFILQKQALSCDEGAVAFRAYRSDAGTPGGTFGTPAPIFANNAMAAAPEYASVITVDSGGTFTPSGAPAEVIRVRSGTATGQRISVGANTTDERGLPAGDYYLTLANIAGSGSATGVYDLVWEERPPIINQWLPDEFGEY